MDGKGWQRLYERHSVDLLVGVNEALARIGRLEQLVTPLSCPAERAANGIGSPNACAAGPSKPWGAVAESLREQAEDRNGELPPGEYTLSSSHPAIQRDLEQAIERVRREEKGRAAEGTVSAPASSGASTTPLKPVSEADLAAYHRGFADAKKLLALAAPEGYVMVPKEQNVELNEWRRLYYERSQELQNVRQKNEELKQTPASAKGADGHPATERVFPLDKVRAAFARESGFGDSWATYVGGARQGWKLAHE